MVAIRFVRKAENRYLPIHLGTSRYSGTDMLYL